LKKRILLIVTLGLVMLLAAGSFSVKAYPGQTNPCGDCHSATGVLALSSNATGTVDATVGVPFVLIVNETGYSEGDTKVAIGLRSGWSDNAQFSFVETSAVEDGEASDLNPAVDEVTASFTLTPLAAGSWTVRFWTAGKAGMVGTSLDVAVSVSAATTTTTTTTTTETTTTTDTTPTGTTSTTTTPANTTPTTPPGDTTLLTMALTGVGIIIVVVIVGALIKKK
jgi:hypothetical protein